MYQLFVHSLFLISLSLSCLCFELMIAHCIWIAELFLLYLSFFLHNLLLSPVLLIKQFHYPPLRQVGFRTYVCSDNSRMFPDSSDLDSSTFLHSVTCYNRHTCLTCVSGCDAGMNVSTVLSEQTDITLFSLCLVWSCFTPLLIIYLGWNNISGFKLAQST